VGRFTIVGHVVGSWVLRDAQVADDMTLGTSDSKKLSHRVITALVSLGALSSGSALHKLHCLSLTDLRDW
jgi:ribonuclease HII